MTILINRTDLRRNCLSYFMLMLLGGVSTCSLNSVRAADDFYEDFGEGDFPSTQTFNQEKPPLQPQPTSLPTAKQDSVPLELKPRKKRVSRQIKEPQENYEENEATWDNRDEYAEEVYANLERANRRDLEARPIDKNGLFSFLQTSSEAKGLPPEIKRALKLITGLQVNAQSYFVAVESLIQTQIENYKQNFETFFGTKEKPILNHDSKQLIPENLINREKIDSKFRGNLKNGVMTVLGNNWDQLNPFVLFYYSHVFFHELYRGCRPVSGNENEIWELKNKIFIHNAKTLLDWTVGSKAAELGLNNQRTVHGKGLDVDLTNLRKVLILKEFKEALKAFWRESTEVLSRMYQDRSAGRKAQASIQISLGWGDPSQTKPKYEAIKDLFHTAFDGYLTNDAVLMEYLTDLEMQTNSELAKQDQQVQKDGVFKTVADGVSEGVSQVAGSNMAQTLLMGAGTMFFGTYYGLSEMYRRVTTPSQPAYPVYPAVPTHTPYQAPTPPPVSRMGYSNSGPVNIPQSQQRQRTQSRNNSFSPTYDNGEARLPYGGQGRSPHYPGSGSYHSPSQFEDDDDFYQ